MPIEIRELVIRTTITDPNQSHKQPEIDIEQLRQEILEQLQQQIKKASGRKHER